MILQVRFHREFRDELMVGPGDVGRALAPESLRPFFRGSVGHHSQFSGQALPCDRRIIRIVVALLPFRVGANHFPLQ